MSKLNKLVQEMCPSGTEFISLNNLVKINTGKLNANAMEEGGQYPFFTCAETPYLINNYSFDTEAILVSGNGSQVGHINYYKGKFNAYQRTYVLSDFSSKVYARFLLFCLRGFLKEYILKNAKEGSVPYITLPMLQNFKIPIPPLEVQKEIVNILDKFTQLEAELSAELEARRRQYEFYRNQLFTFEQQDSQRERDVKWIKLGDVGVFIRGNGLQKKDFTESGFPCIHYGQIYTYYGMFTDKTKSFVSYDLAKKLRKASTGDVIITNTSENLDDVGKAVVWCGDGEVATGGHATIFKPNLVIGKYFAYYTQTRRFYAEKKKYAKGTKVIDVSATDMSKIIIPVPSLDEQYRIVSLLDKFDKLVNDISSGLPAEIAARRKQYEYYRTKLLTFQEIK